jgi:hypothetical protein
MNILIPGAIASIATLGVGAAVGGISAYPNSIKHYIYNVKLFVSFTKRLFKTFVFIFIYRFHKLIVIGRKSHWGA